MCMNINSAPSSTAAAIICAEEVAVASSASAALPSVDNVSNFSSTRRTEPDRLKFYLQSPTKENVVILRHAYQSVFKSEYPQTWKCGCAASAIRPC